MAAAFFACHRQFFADLYGDIYRGSRELYMRNPVFPILHVGCVQGHRAQTLYSWSHACEYNFSPEWAV
jgi:hypothetical protein